MPVSPSDRTSACPAPPELPPADLLHVPCSIPADDDPPDWWPPGTRVEPGGRLFAGRPQATATPVAPVAGVIGAPETVRIVGGKTVHAIELRTDATSPPEPATGIGSADDAVRAQVAARVLADSSSASFSDWFDAILRSGIWADRWTCPDLIGQLRDALSRPIDTLLCNLLDSDPWLPLARVTATSFPLEVACGLGLLGRMTDATNWWAVTDQADTTADALRRAAAGIAGQLRIAPVENDYPQLDPSLLLKATTGRRLRPGKLPTSVGVLLVDAPAAAAIGRLVLGRSGDGDNETSYAADIRLPVIIYDQAGDRIYSFLVAPGTTVGTLTRQIGLPSAVREIYAGGPLRQVPVSDDDVIGGGELTLFAAPPQPASQPVSCVRCGWCIETCPTRCRPAGLLEAAQQQDADLARHHGVDACIECGLCTFVCPSRLPLLDGIRQLRRGIADGLL